MINSKQHLRNYTQYRRGSILIVVISISALMFISMGSFLNLASQQLKTTNKAFFYNACLDLAESGIEDAIWTLNFNNFSGWNLIDGEYTKKISNFNIDSTSTAEAFVVIQNPGSSPKVISEGRVIFANGQKITKQIMIELAPRSMFPNGLTAKNSITFSGGNVAVDAYDSNTTTLSGNRIDRGTVATQSALNDIISISNASIFGYISTGGSDPDIGPNGKVYGADRIDEVEVTNDSNFYIDESRITRDFSAYLADVNIPTGMTPAPYPTGSSTLGDATGATVQVYEISDLQIKSTESLLIEGPTIIFADNLDVKGEILIDQANGSLQIYLTEDLSVAGNGIVNLPNNPQNSPNPEKLLIFGTGTETSDQTFTMGGNSSLAAGIYAPNADVQLNGGGSSGTMYGSIVADNIKITGNYAFRYDVKLGEMKEEQSYRLVSWAELTSNEEKYDFSGWN